MSNENKLNSKKWRKEHCSLDKTVSIPCWIESSSDVGTGLIDWRRIRILTNEKEQICKLTLYNSGDEIPVQSIPNSIKLQEDQYDIAYISSVNKKQHRIVGLEDGYKEMINYIYLTVLKFKDPKSQEVKPILNSKNWVAGANLSIRGCGAIIAILSLLFIVWLCS